MMRFVLLIGLVTLLMTGHPLLASPAAEEDQSDSNLLGKVSLGEHWFGPELKVEDLKGKVTLIEFWGFN